MVQHEDFVELSDSHFAMGGLSPEAVAEGFGFAPDWLPQEFKDFFLTYYSWAVNGVEILPPAPAVVWDNAQEELFNEVYSGGGFLLVGLLCGFAPERW